MTSARTPLAAMGGRWILVVLAVTVWAATWVGVGHLSTTVRPPHTRSLPELIEEIEHAKLTADHCARVPDKPLRCLP